MSQTDFTVLMVYDDDVICQLHSCYYEMFNIKSCLLTFMNYDCMFRQKSAVFKSTGQVALIYSRALKVSGEDNDEFLAETCNYSSYQLIR